MKNVIATALLFFSVSANAEVFWGDRICGKNTNAPASTDNFQLSMDGNGRISAAFDGEILFEEAKLNSHRISEWSDQTWMSVSRHRILTRKRKSATLIYSTQYVYDAESNGFAPMLTHAYLDYGSCTYIGLSQQR